MELKGKKDVKDMRRNAIKKNDVKQLRQRNIMLNGKLRKKTTLPER